MLLPGATGVAKLLADVDCAVLVVPPANISTTNHNHKFTVATYQPQSVYCRMSKSPGENTVTKTIESGCEN